jgi:hydrogenase expression/formation protein HypC
MCLGIPAQILSIVDSEKKLAMVEVSGVQREVNVACILPETGDVAELVGAWALIHVGFAMSRINEEEAAKTLDILTQLGEAQEEIAAMRRAQASLEKAS